MPDPVDRGDIGEIKQSTTHVEAYVEISRDAGSIPAASTFLRKKPFGENVEGLSYCGAMRYTNGHRARLISLDTSSTKSKMAQNAWCIERCNGAIPFALIRLLILWQRTDPARCY